MAGLAAHCEQGPKSSSHTGSAASRCPQVDFLSRMEMVTRNINIGKVLFLM